MLKDRCEGDKDEKLSPEEYLNMIRPFLRDLINKHKPIEELNNNDNDTDNNNNNYNNNNNDNDNNDNNTDRGEWIIQLSIIIRCISTKNFSEKHTMHSKSKAVEVYMGSDTEDVIATTFNTLLQNFQSAQETSNESYIISPDWIARKKATINPKNEKDNKCFQWSIIVGLNYNIIKEKELKKLLKFSIADTDFSSHQRDWKDFEQENNSIALNVLFVSYNSEEIKLA